MAEPVAVAAAYGVESAVEGAAAAAFVIKRPTMPLKADWRQVSGDVALPRSKHTVSLIKGKAYLFGGEDRPGHLADNHIHVLTLQTTDEAQADRKEIEDDSAERPSARSGHSAVVIADRIYLFGGCDSSGKPLQENGRVWIFDTVIGKWSHVDPMPNTPQPSARSRHAAAATVHPLPSQAAHEAGAAAVAPHGSMFVSGGAGADGLLPDCWSFDVAAATWAPLPEPPEPGREGASMTFTGNRIYRFGGSDGLNGLGGQIDYLRIAKSTFDDHDGKSEAAVFAETDKWESVVADDGEPVPGPRSGAGFHPITTGQGRNYILCLLGEKSGSKGSSGESSGYWSDVWSHQTQPTGMTGASLKDATRQLFGAKTAEGSWAPVDIPEFSKTAGKPPSPGLRGYFATAYDETFEKLSVLLWGGIDEKGEVLGDGWLLTVDV